MFIESVWTDSRNQNILSGSGLPRYFLKEGDVLWVPMAGKDPSKYKVWIVKHDGTPFRKTNKANSKTHEVVSEEDSAKGSTVLAAANLSARGDIFVSDMHTLFRKGDEDLPRPPPLGILAEDKKHVLIDDMCKEFKVPGGPPAVVILMGCYTQPLLAKLIASGVGAAFGIAPMTHDDPLVPFPVAINSHAAADTVTEALVLGKTLNEAAELGTDAMKQKLQEMKSYGYVKVVVECGRNNPNKSLQDNKLEYPKLP